METVKIKRLDTNAIIPKYQREGDSGFDLHALENITIYPGATVLVRTGLSFGIPNGYEIQVRPRSGLSFKTPLRVSNSPGTIDKNFTGEVCVIMENKSDNEQYSIKQHDRIAQGVLVPIATALFVEADQLEETTRNDKGFGSTGV